MTAHQPRLAVLGLGTMGAAMAGTAMRSGIPLVVWDRRPGASTDLATHGAQVARSVANAVEEADVVITMVTNADAIVSIATEQGLLRALRPGTKSVVPPTGRCCDTVRHSGVKTKPLAFVATFPCASRKPPGLVLGSAKSPFRGIK
jgi:3-hydroxyisobutyrate dehydrogenase